MDVARAHLAAEGVAYSVAELDAGERAGEKDLFAGQTVGLVLSRSQGEREIADDATEGAHAEDLAIGVGALLGHTLGRLAWTRRALRKGNRRVALERVAEDVKAGTCRDGPR